MESEYWRLSASNFLLFHFSSSSPRLLLSLLLSSLLPLHFPLSVFSSGHDLKEVNGNKDDSQFHTELFSLCSSVMQLIQHLPQPVIAQGVFFCCRFVSFRFFYFVSRFVSTPPNLLFFLQLEGLQQPQGHNWLHPVTLWWRRKKQHFKLPVSKLACFGKRLESSVFLPTPSSCSPVPLALSSSSFFFRSSLLFLSCERPSLTPAFLIVVCFC